MREITAETADIELLAYFSSPPTTTTWDRKGQMVTVPSVPTVDGFCALFEVTPGELQKLVTPRTVELCQAKFNAIVINGGLNRGLDAGFAGLTMKNMAGWKDKSEVATTRVVQLEECDREILRVAGLMVIEGQEVDATNTARSS